ncbi:hypothetical protein IAD21_00166 [Abditibacteriota bacterium]|nr:hypothetical protein IAD21_00166 [Abditibacteriota bacterium]
MRIGDVERLRSWEFVRLVGVSREVYGAMVAAVQEQNRTFGRPPKLPLTDQVLLCLMYWREYRTLAAIGLSYGVSETTAWRTVQKVEGALLASGRFQLPGKKALHSPALKTALVLLDATEVPVQRPEGKKKQARFYSGKKKRHTFKAQVVVEGTTGRLLATAFAPGATHDFALFKASRLWFNTNTPEITLAPIHSSISSEGHVGN